MYVRIFSMSALGVAWRSFNERDATRPVCTRRSTAISGIGLPRMSARNATEAQTSRSVGSGREDDLVTNSRKLLTTSKLRQSLSPLKVIRSTAIQTFHAAIAHFLLWRGSGWRNDARAGARKDSGRFGIIIGGSSAMPTNFWYQGCAGQMGAITVVVTPGFRMSSGILGTRRNGD